MKLFILESSLNSYFSDWATKHNYQILDCSSPDTPARRAYALNQNAIVVPDPRGKLGYVLVVKQLPQ